MKVNEYQQQDILEDRIDFYYRRKNKEVTEILDFLKKHSHRLLGKAKDTEIIFSLKEVYYFESVDKKPLLIWMIRLCRSTHVYRIWNMHILNWDL